VRVDGQASDGMAEIGAGIRKGEVAQKPFRFGVNVSHARSRTEWAEKARKIEELGYATLTVADHLTDFMAPMPALVSAAEATPPGWDKRAQ
jgi:hypothetical protein